MRRTIEREEVLPDLPVFKTLDRLTKSRLVYAFYAVGILHEFNTRNEAEEEREKIRNRMIRGKDN